MTTSGGGIKSKSFRRLRISLRHRWIAGESILNSFHPTKYRFVVLVSLCTLFSLSRTYSKRNRSRDQRDTFSQRPKFQSHTKICCTSSSFCQRLYFSFFEQQQQHQEDKDNSVSLSLSLSLLRSSHRQNVRVLCACKAGVKCEGHKCLFPSSKSSLEKLPFRVLFFLRKKPGWTRDLSPQRIFSSS